MRVSLGLSILSVVLLLVGQAQVARAETFPLYGMGSKPLRSGQLAADVDIASQPIALAVRPDGVVAFGVEDRVYWVLGGRLVRVAVPLRGAGVQDLAFAPDGALLVASCPEGPQEPASVFRAAPGGKATVVAGIPGRRGTSGDGGPATAARLRCARSIAVEGDGSILIADAVANRVRRVDPEGVIHTVAGTGRPTISGDGGAAAAASIGYPTSVAALPGGGFAIAATQGAGFERTKPSIRVVDSAGAISTRARIYATEIAAESDGSLLLVDTFEENAPVRRLSPNGRLSVAADAIRDRVGILEFPRVDGDPFASDDVMTNAAVPTPDGGLLVAADFGISYVAPQRPQTLAVAMLTGTRRVDRDLNVSMRLTHDAHVTVEARRGGRVRASASLDARVATRCSRSGAWRPASTTCALSPQEQGRSPRRTRSSLRAVGFP
jgi:hypothetical protein